MKTFWTIFLTIILWTLFMAVAFGLVTLISSAVNHVEFYQQLRLWFGTRSDFAQIFLK